MSYSRIPGATNLSNLVGLIEGQNDEMMDFQRSANSGAPTIVSQGMVWLRTDHPTYGECYMYYDGAAWVPQAKAGKIALTADGSVVATASQNFGGNIIVGLGAGTASGHSVRYEQVLLLAGGTMAGNIAMGGNKVTGLGAATANGHGLRFEDKWPDTAGIGQAIGPVQVAQASDDANTYQVCTGGKLGTFTPRAVEFWIGGNLVRQSDSHNYGVIPVQRIRVVRFNADGSGARTVLSGISVGLGLTTMSVEIEWRAVGGTPGTRGFWIRIKNTGGDYCNADVEAYAEFAVNQ